MNGKELTKLSNKIQYFKNNPSCFVEDFCRVKLNKLQRYIINNIDKIDIKYNVRHPYKKYQTYIHLCNKYVNMKDNEYIVIASPDKVEKLNKDGLLKYIKQYWK